MPVDAVFTETYDLKKLAYAYENIDIFYDKKSQEVNKKMTKDFLANMLINNGTLEVIYSYAIYTNYGRKYSYGIQCVKRELRNFLLAGSNVKDYDIKSAHPTILYYLCVKHKIHTEKQLLKNYVFNKDEVIEKHFLQETYEGKDVKKLILMATNSDEFLFSKNLKK